MADDEGRAAPLDEALLAELDSGIREVVGWLHRNGFRTTDSGDGRSKFEGGELERQWEGALPFPNVAIVVQAAELVAECDRLAGLLAFFGISSTPMAADGSPAEVTIQGTYEPGSAAVIFLAGLDDDRLTGAWGAR